MKTSSKILRNRQLIPILRFGSSRPESITHRWLSYSAIARMLKCSVEQVRRISHQFQQDYEERQRNYGLKTRQQHHEEQKTTWRRSKLD